MDLLHIVVLGIIQGLTEFLPISSSGHLILVPLIFKWPDQGLAFDISVHLGTLAAVVWYFRAKIAIITQAWVGQFLGKGVNNNSNLGWYIILATIPICIGGLLWGKFVETHLRHAYVIAFTTVFWGILLGLSDVFGKKTYSLSQLNWKKALLIGLAQMIAMVPGTSRSGITMTAGLALGLSRIACAEFSFLLSIPTILLAGGFNFIKLVRGTDPIAWGDFLLGALVSGMVAYLCIHFFMHSISRIGMIPFMVYRLMLGIFIFFFLVA